ncbi:MAG: type I polyketide synthase [Pyrinomonadaceae bacterium]|nr:type I polyketide synthase [Pyrinomonadaceae bacterium]
MRKMEPIAIIGIGCRFPRAENPEAFWHLLRDGVDAISEVPPSRWRLADYYDVDPQAPGKTNARWGGFLADVDHFDPHFFGISPREAVRMDPQQRLMLEVVWEALEDAGQTAQQLSGSRTGVFVGVMNDDHAQRHMPYPELVDPYLGAGSSAAIIANRISYLLDLQGPSLVVDTLCSSSLVAVHLACQSLWQQESAPIAIAGGVNVMLEPTMSIFYAKANLNAPDGRCKSFDSRADGIVRGEGAGVVVLKRLSDAVADQDRIYCVIRGSAVNQDGRSNGLTAPNRWAQIAVLRQAYRRAGVSPATVQYVEAHGTGTPLGDPIEAKALGTVLSTEREPGRLCAIGSVKTNFGHLESAAGIASLIKTALAIKHREIPPSLHYQKANPYIAFAELPLRVQEKLAPWPNDGQLALAGVSSFGLGGTNAHVVVEETPRSPATAAAARTEATVTEKDFPRLVTVSARSPEALTELAQRYHQYLTDQGASVSLPDLCHTLAERRSHHDYRIAFPARSIGQVAEVLDSVLKSQPHPAVVSGRKRAVAVKPVFIYSGQGTQWPGMGRGLMHLEPFRSTIEQCDQLLRAYSDWSLIDELLADQASRPSRLDQTEIAQPALFALQLALTAQWRAWGIEPAAVIGHSIGEVAAAQIAGLLNLEDAIRIVFHRGRLMQQATGKGRMASVEIDEAAAQQLIVRYEGRLSLAACNAPQTSVISGEGHAVTALVGELAAQGISCRMLPVNYAFHSRQMEGLAEELAAALGEISTGSLQLPIYSTVSGQLAGTPGDYEAAYWGRQMCTTVRFKEAVETACNAGHAGYVEVGPHPVLCAAVRQIVGAEAVVVSSLRRSMNESEQLLSGLSQLYVSGCTPQWPNVNPGGQSVALPAYAWQRQRYFFEGHFSTDRKQSRQDAMQRRIPGLGGEQATHPLLGKCLKSAVHAETYFWATDLNTEFFPYLGDHRVRGSVIFPAAAYVEMALAAANELFGVGKHMIEEIEFEKALLIPERSTLRLQLVATRDELQQISFRFLSQLPDHCGPQQEATLHARGKMRNGCAEPARVDDEAALEVVRRRCAQTVSGTEFYEALAQRGLQYGHSFQGVEQLWRGEQEAVARLEPTDTVKAQARDYLLHPALLDVCFQILASTLPGQLNGANSDTSETYLPVGIDRIRLLDNPHSGRWGHAQLGNQAVVVNGDRGSQAGSPPGVVGNGKATVAGDVSLFDEDGNLVAAIEGLRAQKVQGALPRANEDESDWFYELRWEPQASFVRPEAEVGSNRPGKWLIFADADGAGEALKLELAVRGETSILVTAADSFRSNEMGSYQINPLAPEQVQRVLHDAFTSHGLVCRGVVHLWAMDAARPEKTTLDSLKRAQELGALSVLHLVQGLVRAAFREAPPLWLVTRGAQYTGPQDKQLSIGQSAIWGLGRTIRHEHAELRCRLVDLDGAHGDSLDEARALCDLLRHPQGETQFALRDETLYVGRVANLAAHTPTEEEKQSAVPIRADASYLISGGAGGLGLLVAAWMIEKGARHLVLLGRNAASAEAQQKINFMERAGARVMLLRGDVTRDEDVRMVLAKMALDMPPLRGVVHAAGALDDGILLQLDQERFNQVAAPKIAGAWNLHQATLIAPLDFFILFSSLASLVGSPGQGNYAAANAFLDGLAWHRRLSNVPALSINWGPWAEVGMAAGQPGQKEQFALSGLKRLAPEQGIKALERLLGVVSTQVGVMPLSAAGKRALAVFTGAKAAQPADNEGRPTSAASFRQRLDEAEARERMSLLVDHVRSAVGRVLGHTQANDLDPQRGLFEMGMDSLMAVELSRSIQASLTQSIPLTVVFDHPTIESLARHLLTAVLQLESSSPEHMVFSDPGLQAGSAGVVDNGSVGRRQQIEELSEDEAMQLLAEKLSFTEGMR